MNMNAQARLLQLFHLNDSAFPTGAFSHSFGLETYTQTGTVRDASTLRAYLTGRLLDGMVRFDLVFLREALHAAQVQDTNVILELDQRLSAMMTVQELREASTQIGRRFLRAAAPLYGNDIDFQHTILMQARAKTVWGVLCNRLWGCLWRGMSIR